MNKSPTSIILTARLITFALSSRLFFSIARWLVSSPISQWCSLNTLVSGLSLLSVVVGLATSGVGYGCLSFHSLIRSAVGYMVESHYKFHASDTGWHVSTAAFSSASARVFLLRVTWVWYTPPPSSRQTCLTHLTS